MKLMQNIYEHNRKNKIINNKEENKNNQTMRNRYN